MLWHRRPEETKVFACFLNESKVCAYPEHIPGVHPVPFLAATHLYKAHGKADEVKFCHPNIRYDASNGSNMVRVVDEVLMPAVIV